MIETKIENDLATIRMDHGKVNALDVELCTVLRDKINELVDSDCKAIILTGKGTVFSAGVDLVRMLEEDVDYLNAFLPALINLFTDVFFCRKPMIAAINGHAIAGGCILGCGCDYRLMSPGGKIGIPELRVGVPLPNIAIETMRFVTAPQFFQPMVNVGSTLSPQLAVDAGLVNEVVEQQEMASACKRVATEFINVPPTVFRLTKEQLRTPSADRLALAEETFGKRIQAMWRDPAIRQGVKEYVESTLKKSTA